MPLRGRAAACAVIGALLLMAPGASAQDATQPAPSPPPGEAPARPPDPGLFGAIGRLIDQSIVDVGTSVKTTTEQLNNVAKPTGDLTRGVQEATDSVVRLPKTVVVTGREVCANAPNGAPDCVSATEALCKAKGFATGRSLDITSAQKCPKEVWLQGRVPTASECLPESIVTRAVCQ